MKKVLMISLVILTIASCGITKSMNEKRRQKLNNNFNVINDTVYYQQKPLAIYQAKTYSLDGGDLVEEYNLITVCDVSGNKQIIGDLIDFISDRHSNAEVEVEVPSKNSPFKL